MSFTQSRPINPQEKYINNFVVARLCPDTHDNVNDVPYGCHLRAEGFICSGEVLSEILVCGDDRQSGLLEIKQLNK